MSDEYLNLFTARKYNFFDYLRIPFQIAPIYIIVFIANEIFAGVLPSVNVIITARFIDAIKSYIELSHGMKSIIIYFALMIFILVYQYLNRALMSFIGSKFRIKLDEQIAIEILTKRSALKYENVENDAIYELVTRVCGIALNLSYQNPYRCYVERLPLYVL